MHLCTVNRDFLHGNASLSKSVQPSFVKKKTLFFRPNQSRSRKQSNHVYVSHHVLMSLFPCDLVVKEENDIMFMFY